MARAYLDMAMGHIQKKIVPGGPAGTQRRASPCLGRDPFFLSVAAFVHGRLGQMEQAGKLVEEMQAASKKELCGSVPLLQQLLWEWARRKRRWTLWKRVYKAHDPYMVGLNSTPWFWPVTL